MSTPSSVTPIPPDMHTITPHLICDDASAAIDFYVKAFGAVELARLPTSDGRLLHAMIRIGDSPLMLADRFPEIETCEPTTPTGSAVIVHLYVEDVDTVMARAEAAGARIVMPPDDMFWGDRYGRLEDPFGHHWSVATHVRDVPPEEIEAVTTGFLDHARSD